MALPTNISDAVRRLNPHLFGEIEANEREQNKPKFGFIADPAPARKRIRQASGDAMNQWERDWHTRLQVIGWQFIYREVSLPLANGLRYKVDFLAVGPPNQLNGLRVIEGFEVKGHARSTGIAKLKMAARLYPWIQFRLVTKRRKRDGGGWDIQDVLA